MPFLSRRQCIRVLNWDDVSSAVNEVGYGLYPEMKAEEDALGFAILVRRLLVKVLGANR